MVPARAARERAVKEALLRELLEHHVSVDDVKEWLWEDFGIRVSGGWERVRRVILREKRIRAQDIVSFMDEVGLTPDEGAWDAAPVPRLRSGEDAGDGG